MFFGEGVHVGAPEQQMLVRPRLDIRCQCCMTYLRQCFQIFQRVYTVVWTCWEEPHQCQHTANLGWARCGWSCQGVPFALHLSWEPRTCHVRCKSIQRIVWHFGPANDTSDICNFLQLQNHIAVTNAHHFSHFPFSSGNHPSFFIVLKLSFLFQYCLFDTRNVDQNDKPCAALHLATACLRWTIMMCGSQRGPLFMAPRPLDRRAAGQLFRCHPSPQSDRLGKFVQICFQAIITVTQGFVGLVGKLSNATVNNYVSKTGMAVLILSFPLWCKLCPMMCARLLILLILRVWPFDHYSKIANLTLPMAHTFQHSWESSCSEAMDRGQPVLLPPGLHQWDSPTIERGLQMGSWEAAALRLGDNNIQQLLSQSGYMRIISRSCLTVITW